jgi:hypothetical protein
MLYSILQYFCMFLGIVLAIGVILIAWVGPILMMLWSASPWWLLGYFITIPVFCGICDWSEGDGF